jgi:alkylated DNA nucleotide flippase Atl1
VDEQLRALDELEELVGHVGEARLVGEVLGREPCTWWRDVHARSG